MPSRLSVGAAMLLFIHCGGGGAVALAPATGGAAGNDSGPRCPVVKSPPPPVLACSAAADGTASTVDDFNDGDLLVSPVEQRVGRWYTFTDNTAGCVALSVDEAEDSPALHLSGGGFSAWGAAFGTAFAWSNAQSGLCTYDVSAYSGVRFRARGDAPLRMNVASRATAFKSAGGDCPDSEGCFDQPGRAIALSSEYQTFEISFCSLTQEGFGAPLGGLNTTQTTNLNFLVRTKASFDVWLDDLEFIPWQAGQAHGCPAVCPSDELAAGIRPRPQETTVDQEATGVRLFTFEQPTKDCGSVSRRYLSYVPKQLASRSDAPVVIVLHGLGADAESMRQYITQGRFEALAERDGFIVVYGNAAPSAGTVSERPNGGGFRKDAGAPHQVNDFAYLDGIIADMASRGTISGKNPLFLAGLSDGGGLSHMAALEAPTRFLGIAEVMPYPGVTVAMPPSSGGFALKRVLVAYSATDPGLPAGYDVQLAKLGPAWAAALALSSDEQRSPQTRALPDRVNEGANYQGTTANGLRTRDSRAEQIDYGSATSVAQVRVLRFDHAGHLWPVANPQDREQEIAQFGFRNQDIDMSDVIWDFFRSSL